MIRSLGDKGIERIWQEQSVDDVDRNGLWAALRKLELIHAANDVELIDDH